jgi:molybdate transport system substrate-binding protein
LVKQGKVSAGTRTAFVRSGLGIGVHKGAPKPDISSVDAFKRALLNAKSVGYGPDSEPGVQFLEVLDRLGIAQDMRPRLKPYRGGITEMGTALQKREVEMVFSSTTNLLEAATEIDFAGSLPSGIQRYIAHVAGISATTKEPEAAKALLGFLMLPTATSVFKAKGFERE